MAGDAPTRGPGTSTARPRTVEGVVQHYAWGDPAFIPRLLGRPENGRPWAELWLGTHPNGPTRFADGTPLSDVTGELPYLLKVLAAASPLSLQAHPTTAQAVEGHARGVFADPRAKPELLCALTPFEALCGVRPPGPTVELLTAVGAHEMAAAVARDGPATTIRRLYRGELAHDDTIAACRTSDRPEARWADALDERYPDDPSVAITLLLNHVVLTPGEALHLEAGNLHAYLRGAGIELMGASDNVVRGGLTVKDVDVDTLLDVVDPKPLLEPVMTVRDGTYPLPEAAVTLVAVDAGRTHTSHGHELAVALDGETAYLPPGASWTPSATAYVACPWE